MAKSKKSSAVSVVPAMSNNESDARIKALEEANKLLQSQLPQPQPQPQQSAAVRAETKETLKAVPQPQSPPKALFDIVPQFSPRTVEEQEEFSRRRNRQSSGDMEELTADERTRNARSILCSNAASWARDYGIKLQLKVGETTLDIGEVELLPANQQGSLHDGYSVVEPFTYGSESKRKATIGVPCGSMSFKMKEFVIDDANGRLWKFGPQAQKIRFTWRGWRDLPNEQTANDAPEYKTVCIDNEWYITANGDMKQEVFASKLEAIKHIAAISR